VCACMRACVCARVCVCVRVLQTNAHTGIRSDMRHVCVCACVCLRGYFKQKLYSSLEHLCVPEKLAQRVHARTHMHTQALRSCRDMAHRSFLEHLRVRGEKLVQQTPEAPPDLTVPPQVRVDMRNSCVLVFVCICVSACV